MVCSMEKDNKKRKPRNCGQCYNFNFDWTRHWCSAGEKITIPTAEYPSSWFPYCNK